MLPFSFVVSQKLVTHWNFGATVIPNAKDPQQQQARSVGYNLGQSFVYLAKPRFNLMLETVFTSSQAVIGENRTEWSRLLLINPGVRWSYNFKNGLQIVPGVSAPIGAGPSAGEKGIFMYLSFEHPFRKLPDK